MIIREATIDDAQFIALLARITFDESFGHLFRDRQDLLTYFEKTFSVQKVKSSIEKENNIFWIAFVDNLPVAYAKLKLHSPNEFLKKEATAQLQKIYVLKDFLSQKIGLHLQMRMLDKAKEYDKKHIWLSVLHSNERAINFYIKNDFKQVGKHSFSIGQEDFLFIAMAKEF